MRNGVNISKVFSIITFCNLFSIILCYTVLNNSTLLIYFYALSFVVEFLLFINLMYGKNIYVDKKSILLFGIFLGIMIFPICTNTIIGIDTNIYDLLSIIFKCTNFFFLFCIIKKLNVTESNLRRYFKIILVIGVISCLYNFIFCFKDILAIITATSSYQVNVKSFFVDRNMFGDFMIISTLSCYYYFSKSDNKKVRNVLLALFSINSFLTFSRTSIVSIILILIYMIYNENKKSKRLFIITFIILLIVSILFSSNIKSFISVFIVRGDNFSTGRTSIWKIGLDIFKHNPINGIGYYTAVDIANNMGMNHSQFHSFFVDSLVGYGIIGLTFNIGIFLYCFINCIKKCILNNYKQIYVISFIVIFIQMFIESVSVFSVGYSDLVTTIFYISIPLLLTNMEEDKNE